MSLVNSGVQSARGGKIREQIRHRDLYCQNIYAFLRIRRQTIQSRGKSSLRCFVVFVHTVFRYGEARHPGPAVSNLGNKIPGFLIGLINPTGLLHKAEIINSLPQGTQGTIWLVSETHLTPDGGTQFRRALQCTRSPYKLLHGEYVPPKSTTQSYLSVRGKERGVGFLASTPGRHLMHSWPPEIVQQQRCHVAGFQFGQQWIQGGVFYGNAFQSTGLQTREQNNALLSHVVDRIHCGAKGPRFIGGDFNHFIDELPNAQTLLSQGWEEVQHLAYRKFGQHIEPTIQNKHTKDLLFLSPELCPLVTEVHVESDWVASHSVVYAVLHDHAPTLRVPIWKQPRPIDWSQLMPTGAHPLDPVQMEPAESDLPSSHSTNADAKYRAVWRSFESQMVTQARNQGHNLHGSQTGRGATLTRSWITERFVPLRPSRPGSFTPTFHGQNNLHTHWVKQLRRLQTLAQMHHSGHVPNGHWIERKLGQWRAIRRATGFRPTFEQWWSQKAKHIPGLPDSLPCVPPDGDLAGLLALDFHKDLAHLEQLLWKTRAQKAKQDRLDNPHRIFRDLAAARPEPVQSLLAHTIATITSIDLEDNAVVLDTANAFGHDQPIEHDGKPLSVIHYDTDNPEGRFGGF